MTHDLDEFDISILSLLQQDGTLSAADIGEKVHLSQNACWRRIKQMEASGVIQRRVAILNPERLGLPMTVIVMVRAAEHSESWLETFSKAVADIPEVVEFYRMSGDIDYLLKLRVADIQAYDAVYKRLIRSVRLTDVSSSFAMEEMKHTTALPLRPSRIEAKQRPASPAR